MKSCGCLSANFDQLCAAVVNRRSASRPRKSITLFEAGAGCGNRGTSVTSPGREPVAAKRPFEEQEITKQEWRNLMIAVGAIEQPLWTRVILIDPLKRTVTKGQGGQRLRA